MSPVRVKVCGVTRLSDALEASRLGADALGFNFWPRSKRYCAPEIARDIVSRLPPFVATVGVFVNQSTAQIRRVVARTGIQTVQLHGDETPRRCAALEVPVIKALRVDGADALAALERYTVAAFLLDAPSEGYGGSGRTFDWSLVRDTARTAPIILAGGLTPGNVMRAVRRVRPYGVDVASGVEAAPGIKDAKKMERFIAAAKEG